MSGKRLQRMLIGSVAVFGLAANTPAQPLDVLSGLNDPLHTAPKRLERAALQLGGVSPGNCLSDTASTGPLGLAEAVDLALCNNPLLRASWAAIKVQAGVLGEANAAYLPTLQGTVSRLSSRTTFPGSNVQDSSSDRTTLYAGLSWRIFDFGGRAANVESARQMLLAALASHDAVLQSSMSGAVQAYFESVMAQAAFDARNVAVLAADGTLAAARRRESRGAAAHNDTLQAGAASAKAALARSRAGGELRKSLAVLAYALGIPAEAAVTVAGIDAMDDFVEQGGARTDAQSLNDWLDIAREGHPAILAARAQWQAAKGKVIAVASDGLPTVSVTTNRYENGYPAQGLSPTKTRISTVGVALNIPLFDGFSRGYKIQGARAQAEQSEAQMRDTESQILRDVVKAYADEKSSFENLESSQALIRTARESQASSERRYEKGVADIVEVLAAQSAWAEAQQERVRCISEWRSARLRILTSVGRLGRTLSLSQSSQND